MEAADKVIIDMIRNCASRSEVRQTQHLETKKGIETTGQRHIWFYEQTNRENVCLRRKEDNYPPSREEQVMIEG